MRVLVACLMALGIAVSPAIAGSGGAADKASAGAAETSKASSAEANSGNPPEASKANTPAKPAETVIENELQELRELIESQQKQLQAQSQQLKDEQQQMQALRNQLTASPLATAGAGAGASSSLTAAVAASPEAIAAPVSPNGALSPNAAPKAANQAPANDQPPALRYKGITLTPGGYFAAETVWRNRAIGSDINSAFNSVPLPGNEQSHITEFNASARQSRIAMLAQGKLKSVAATGYYEADFLSAGVTSNDNQSNSYTLRQRQFWGQAKFDSGLTFTGGQMWSLVTETRNGVDNRTEATTQTIDAQYNSGFSWARQYGFRVSKNIGSQFWLAASVEEGQTTVATPHCVVGTAGSATCSASQNPSNFQVGSFGVTGGLYNPLANYAFVTAPDFVVKAVFQPKGWGHYEVFGLLTTVRDRVYPCEAVGATTSCGGVVGPSGALAFNDTRNGGGIGANARARFFKHLDLGMHFFGGDGIGRYGSAGLSQVTVRPDGTLAPIRNYQSLGTIELYTNKLDVYGYVGDEYEARAVYTQPGTPNTPANAVTTGYGSPLFSNRGCFTEPVPGAPTSTATGVGGAAGFVPGGLSNCTNDTKHLIEGTVGFWYRFYRGPVGTLQFGMQESYFVRYLWPGLGNAAGTTSVAPHGTDNMVFTSFRYVLP
jgi:hypothetical protein